MPITAYTTLLGAVVMAGSWFLIGQRIKSNPLAVSAQIRYLHNFFLLLGIFFVCMFSPNLLILFNPPEFPIAMAWGYVIGHGFMYGALANVAMLFFSMIPRLASKVQYPLYISLVVGAVITIANTITMPFGTQPSFSSSHQVVEFNTASGVGIGIAAFAAVTVFPTAILMIINGIQKPAARVRSFLLGSGLFVLMAAGPIHDNARTAMLYAIADIISLVSILLIAGGILYRFEERLPLGKTATVDAAADHL